MTISLHSSIVGAYLQGLPPLSALVDKAQEYAASSGKSEAEVLALSVAPDMWPLNKQIAVACSFATTSISCLKEGIFSPDLSPPPADFAGLKAMVENAITYLKGVSPSDVDGALGKDVTFVFGERRMPFIAEDFLQSFALPNFYFHCATAYGLLRAQGLPIGKKDYIGAFRLKA